MSLLKRLIVGVFSFTVVFVGLILLLVILLILRTSEGKPTEVQKTEMYKYYRFNPSTNESDIGFMTLFSKDFGDEDYVYYQDEESNHILISNFGINEYRCTGRCACDDTRRLALPIARGMLIYLVAATGSYIAFEQAREYFDLECREEMKDECPNSAVLSQVDECERVDGNEETEENSSEERVNEMKSFLCKGNCIPMVVSKGWDLPKKKLSKLRREVNDKQCDKIAMDVTIEVWREEFLREIEDQDLAKRSGVAGGSIRTEQDLAKVNFIFEHLHPFCEKSSVVGEDIDDPDSYSLCSGLDESIAYNDGPSMEGFSVEGFMKHPPRKMNPSVNCLLQKRKK